MGFSCVAIIRCSRLSGSLTGKATLATEQLYYNIPDNAGVRVNKSTVSGYPSDTYTSPNELVMIARP